MKVFFIGGTLDGKTGEFPTDTPVGKVIVPRWARIAQFNYDDSSPEWLYDVYERTDRDASGIPIYEYKSTSDTPQ